MAAQEYTTIPVKPRTRDRIRAMKRGGDSYTDVLERLLQESENHR